MHTNLIKVKFFELFNKEPLLVRSPGRINLIGEQADHNDGFVFPAAMDKQMIVAVASNNSNSCRIYAYELNEIVQLKLEELKPKDKSWANYLLGVVDQLQKAGHRIEGFDCVFGGDIPMGAGLPFSTALECATAYALDQLFELEMEKGQLIKYAQKAELTFGGL
jgi:galactokinase